MQYKVILNYFESNNISEIWVLSFLQHRWHLWDIMYAYMWNIYKNALKYVHNAMKTPFFHFTLDYRRLIAHRCCNFWHLYVILLLNFHQLQIRSDLLSASLPFSLFNFDPFKQKLQPQQLWSPFPVSSSR